MPRWRAKAAVSARMRRVRSSGSKMEREFAAALRGAGIPFRRQYPALGRPDFVILKPRVAIFCDSRFWHGYRWTRHSGKFGTNAELWIQKIEGNRRRDRLVNRGLRERGWRVLRFWEHQISRDPGKCVVKVLAAIRGGRQAPPG